TAPTRHVHFKLCGAVDIDRNANDTYRRMLGIDPLEEDVRQLTTRAGLRRAVEHWQINSDAPLILIGCAPCQGFSSHRKKDPREDDRNTLLESFGIIIERLRPNL